MNNKLILILSIIINMLFVCATGYIIHRRGGIRYIVTRFQTSKYEKKKDNPSYIHRTTTFECLPNSQDAFVFLGDSITHGNEWQEFFLEYKVLNRGISGDTSDGVLRRIDQIIQLKPSKLFIMIGTNDLTNGIHINSIVKNYENLIKKVISECPKTQIYLQSVLPIDEDLIKSRVTNKNIIALNVKLQQTANEYNVSYIDLYSIFVTSDNQLDLNYSTDGVHINGKGYLVWIDAINVIIN